MEAFAYTKTMQMGLGEAIQRLNLLHGKITRSLATPNEREEYRLILDALNETKLDLGFDCNDDNIPDTIEIFTKTAKTSCCRILPTGGSRRKKKSASRSGKKPKVKKARK